MGSRWRKVGRLFRKSLPAPVQISHGQINSLAPVFSLDGKKLFVIGQQLRGELQHLDTSSEQFVPYLNGMSADFAEFSRDGKWLLYVAFPEGTLWRSKADGSERRQLTFRPLQALVPHWSTNGKRILFHGLGGGRDEVYIIPADGGEPLPVTKDSGKQIMNETWSPDGNSIAYSDYPFFVADPSRVKVHVLDLKTNTSLIYPVRRAISLQPGRPMDDTWPHPPSEVRVFCSSISRLGNGPMWRKVGTSRSGRRIASICSLCGMETIPPLCSCRWIVGRRKKL